MEVLCSWRCSSFFVVLYMLSCLGNTKTYKKFSKLNESLVEVNSLGKNLNRLHVGESDKFSRRHRRFQAAAARHAHLNSFSTDPLSAKYGFTQFSDLTQEEFRDIYLQTTADPAPSFPGPVSAEPPTKFDWRNKAVVAPVQNQLACGSCWAFAVVGAVQSVYALGGAGLQQLSVQQLLDCSYTNRGCSGGSPPSALLWLQQTRVKLVTKAEYPYKAETGICHFFAQSHAGVTLKNFTVYNFSGREEAMMAELVERGPLVAVVDAVSWQDYLGGIIQHHCSSRWSNHAVLVVGYDATGEIPYWIVQNSWGKSWGDAGYVYIKIGGNTCGIADSVAAVLL